MKFKSNTSTIQKLMKLRLASLVSQRLSIGCPIDMQDHCKERMGPISRTKQRKANYNKGELTT